MVKKISYGGKHERKTKLRHLISRLEDDGFKIATDKTHNNRISEYTLSVNGEERFKLMVQMLIIRENGRIPFHAILFRHDKNKEKFGKYTQIQAYKNQISVTMFADQLKKDALTEMF